MKLDISGAKTLVDALWAREDALIESVVADGWPEEMARAGFEGHRKTWDIEALARSVKAELGAVADKDRYRLRWPGRVHHIWPALPGAGMTPVLMGVLLGISQGVRPSRRGLHFGRLAAEIGGWDLIEPGESWEETDVIVVSGSDETLEQIGKRVGPASKVVGYGHRVSFAVVVDGDGVDLVEAARGISRDVVMWHQGGCFSVRAVLFAGEGPRRNEFCRLLAKAIDAREKEWGAVFVEQGQLAARAQALGLAQMKGPVFTEGVGYVRPVDGPFRGENEAIHSVTVHDVGGPLELAGAVDLPVRHIQGVAMSGAWRDDEEAWIDGLGRLGATRIAAAGQMQAPPAGWWHDGRPNALSWARVLTVG